MTTCYFVSDLHGDKNKYELLAREIIKHKAPFLFLGGDLLPHVHLSEKERNPSVNPFITEFMIPLFKKVQNQLGCNYPEVYLILGNDDYKADIPGFYEGESKDLWKFLNSSKIKFGPYQIYGYSYIPPTPFRIKDWEKQDELIADDLDALTGTDPLDKAILIMHSPPYGCALDIIPGNQHIGSRAIANFVKEKQPYITLHGHAHEAPGISGTWHLQTGKTHSFTAAHDGNELAIVIFQIDNPSICERKLIK